MYLLRRKFTVPEKIKCSCLEENVLFWRTFYVLAYKVFVFVPEKIECHCTYKYFSWEHWMHLQQSLRCVRKLTKKKVHTVRRKLFVPEKIDCTYKKVDSSWEHLQENWLFMGKCNVLNLKVYCSWENWMFLLGRKCVLFLKTWLLVLCQQYSSNLLASEGMLTQSYLYVFGDKLHEHI